MTSRRYVVFALILCTIMLWLVSRPSAVRFGLQDAGPAQESANRQPATAGSEGATFEEAASPVFESPSGLKSRPNAFRGSAEDLRKAIRQARIQSVEMPWSARYKNYRERYDVKAVPKRIYQASFGNIVSDVGGYAVYGVTRSPSTLENFDDTRMPVVTDGRARTGIVNGDILVVFRKYPSNVEQFASLYDLKVIREMRHAQTVFFSPRHLPANLISRVESLIEDPMVGKADLDIIFRSPVPQ